MILGGNSPAHDPKKITKQKLDILLIKKELELQILGNLKERLEDDFCLQYIPKWSHLGPKSADVDDPTDNERTLEKIVQI